MAPGQFGIFCNPNLRNIYDELRNPSPTLMSHFPSVSIIRDAHLLIDGTRAIWSRQIRNEKFLTLTLTEFSTFCSEYCAPNIPAPNYLLRIFHSEFYGSEFSGHVINRE